MKIRKAFVSLACLFSFASASAYDFVIDGIYYNINADGETCSVTNASFSGNSYLGEITVPSSVTYQSQTYQVTQVGDEAFYSCKLLCHVSLPESISRIGKSAFGYCQMLESVDLPSGLSEIDSNAFGGCSAMMSVVIPDEVTVMGSSVFNGCSSLNDVKLPSSLLEISSYMFESCKALTRIDIPSSVIHIGSNAFSGCTSLSSIRLPEGATEIDERAFYSCTELRDITLPSGELSLGDNSFGYVPVEVKTAKLYISCPKDAISVTIPEGIQEICPGAFRDCNSLTDIYIPQSVTTIGESAFSGCKSLSSLTIPSSVSSIENYAFYYCSGLKSIALPSTCQSIGDYAFAGSGLTSIQMPEGCQSIGAYAFQRCSSIQTISIPSTVSSIGENAFQDCLLVKTALKNNSTLTSSSDWGATMLDKITADGFCYQGTKLVKYIGDGGEVVIPVGTTDLSTSLFSYNKSIISVVIPEGVTTIPSYTFEGCTEMKFLHIPASVTHIESSSVLSCKNFEIDICDLKAWCNISYKYDYYNPLSEAKRLLLNGQPITNLDIPEGVTRISSYTFKNCTDVRSITIPSTMTSISSGAFNSVRIQADKIVNHSELDPVSNKYWGAQIYDQVTDDGFCISSDGTLMKYVGTDMYVIVPDGVTVIGRNAFQNTKVISVDIPNSVSLIDYGAFQYCYSLESVYIPNSVTEIGSYAFSSCNALESVILPRSITKLGSSVFSYCSALSSISIPSGITLLGSQTFYNCINLHTVNFAGSGAVTKIGTDAFNGCKSLSAITLPASLAELGSTAFSGCSSLQGISIPAQVSTIGADCFKECYMESDKFVNQSSLDAAANDYWGVRIYDERTSDGLIIKDKEVISYQGNGTEVVIPDYVTSIGESAFSGKSELTYVKIPYGVTTIKSHAFSDCSRLQPIRLPVSVTSVESSGLSYLESIPNSINSLSPYMFSSSKMDEVYVPASVSYVSRGPLNDAKKIIFEDVDSQVICQDRNAKDGYFPSALSSVKDLYVGSNLYGTGVSYAGELLSESVEQITFGPLVSNPLSSYYNLRRCKNIQKVTCLSKRPFTYPEFEKNPTFLVYVPKGSKEAYKAVEGWSACSILEVNTVKITLSSQTQAYTPDFDIDLTGTIGLKAYIVKAIEDGKAILERVLKVQAGQGVILKGEFGVYNVPCTSELTDDLDSEACLIGTISGTYLVNSSTDEFTNYYLSETDGVFSFKPADSQYGIQLHRNQAYLRIAQSVAELLIEILTPEGDADGDGILTNEDALVVMKHILNLSGEGVDLESVDVNHDGNITISDIVWIIDHMNR